MDRKFNVRVYGICFNEKNELLVADELIKGREITKLPGGGLEFGEGTIDCVRREFVEETGQEVEVLSHFYTTDFFVPSAFNPRSQVISIYYLVKFLKPPAFKVTAKPFDFPVRDADVFVFRWMPASIIHPDEFTFAIDKRVAEMLRAKMA
ncbi:MAG TPA: NUDIX domain-containing protein [Bacteroidia bacterium]|jgi:ADP-ribose pyrophosphatase YjhB (NUDIX family)